VNPNLLSDNKFFDLRTLAVVAVVSLSLLMPSTVHAEHWPQFRGANGDGVAASNFPDDWDAEKNVRWKIPIEGEGWSCPIAWGDQVFFTAAVPIGNATAAAEPYREGQRPKTDLTKINYRWDVICVDAKTGQLQWRETASEGNPRRAQPAAASHNGWCLASEDWA